MAVLARHLLASVTRSLAHFPVVTLTGARQVGKSTLAEKLVPSMKARYLTLDDRATLDAALGDPDGLLAGMEGPAVLDEVQRAPDLMRAIKKVVDADRRPGRFLLTGSAHLSTLSRVAESLAGRAALHELHPLSWSELARRPAPSILDDLFAASSATELLSNLKRRAPASRRAELVQRILAGGFPSPALMRDGDSRRVWFESYRQTYLERDLRQLAAIQDLPAFNRLMTLVALRTGQMLNVSDLARDAQLSTTTTRRHLDLLQQTYQIFLVQPYFQNVGKRLVKTPKLYVMDTGLGCHLAAVDGWQAAERQQRTGGLVETFVAAEIRKLMALAPGRSHLWYWRVEHGREVDFLLERGGDVVAIEVKWSTGASPEALAGLKGCRDALGKRFRLGILLYGGEETLALDPSLAAVPISVFLGREG